VFERPDTSGAPYAHQAMTVFGARQAGDSSPLAHVGLRGAVLSFLWSNGLITG
jgi:hypothetical protein